MTSRRLRKSQLAGLSSDAEALESDLLKLRAVLILLQAQHGAKVQRALLLVRELQAAAYAQRSGRCITGVAAT